MLELLFLIALIAWLAFSALEFVLSLPCAPTLVAAFVLVPLLSVYRHVALARLHCLGPMRPGRRPVPPEKFFWPLARRRIGLGFAAGLSASAVFWPVALFWPARWEASASSLTGWISGAVAILAVSELMASGCLYVRASHWFDRCAPNFVGWARRLLYRISDNHEFLGEEPLPRERRRREKVF